MSIPLESPIDSHVRPRWRLHVSTWILVAVATFLLLFLDVFGIVGKSLPATGPKHIISYGCPATYMEREGDSVWQPRKRCMYRQFWLYYDLVCIVAFVGAGALAHEWIRRKRNRPWQFSLRTALIVMAIFACSAGYGTWNRRTEQLVADGITSLGGEVIWKEDAPPWLKGWTGSAFVKPWEYVSEATLRYDKLAQGLPVLTKSRRLWGILITDAPPCGNGLLCQPVAHLFEPETIRDEYIQTNYSIVLNKEFSQSLKEIAYKSPRLWMEVMPPGQTSSVRSGRSVLDGGD